MTQIPIGTEDKYIYCLDHIILDVLDRITNIHHQTTMSIIPMRLAQSHKTRCIPVICEDILVCLRVKSAGGSKHDYCVKVGDDAADHTGSIDARLSASRAVL